MKLIVFSGLPGTGKSALAETIGRETGIPVFAFDWLMGVILTMAQITCFPETRASNGCGLSCEAFLRRRAGKVSAKCSSFRSLMLWLLALLWIMGGTGAVASQSLAAPYPVLDLMWSPNGATYATVDNQGNLTVVAPKQQIPIFQFSGATTLAAAAVAWSPQGDRLAAGIGSTVFIWDSENWELLHQFAAGNPSSVILFNDTQIPEGIVNIRWSGDGHYLVTGSSSYITTVWDTQTVSLIYQAPDNSGGGPGRVWLSDDGWMSDGLSKLNAFTGELDRPNPSENFYLFGGSAEDGTTEPRPDHKQIAWGTAYGILGIIDLDTLRTLQGIQVTVNDPASPARGLAAIAWDSTWNFITAASKDGELYVVNLATGEVTTVLKINGELNAVAWNPKNNELIYSGISATGQAIVAEVSVQQAKAKG